mmetsp:Transcript_25382/g.22522  ORF Transcript_25382/g.22522 Transcript_25382/m.22522 type:complete len:185 (+) Transcript_25382:473-1027(+)
MKAKHDEVKITRKQFINMQNSDGLTSLHFSGFRGSIKMIKFLTRKGASPALKDNQGRTVLHVSTQSDEVASIYYFVKHHNLDINEQDNNKSTSLHWAAIGQKEVSLTYLIAWGAKVNIKDTDGNTPLHLAVRSTVSTNTRCIKILLLKGANRGERNISDYLPIQMIQESFDQKELNQVLSPPNY